MPLWLIKNWNWAVPVGALVLSLVWGTTGWWRYTALRAESAEYRRDMADLALEALDKARETESKNAELARDIDTAYAAARAADAGRGDVERDYTERLRRARAACRGTVPGATPTSGGAAGGASERSDRLLSEIGRDLAEVRAGATELADIVRLVCVPWAAKVGG